MNSVSHLIKFFKTSKYCAFQRQYLSSGSFTSLTTMPKQVTCTMNEVKKKKKDVTLLQLWPS